MSEATYIVEVPAIEMRHGKSFEESTLRAHVNRIKAIWQERQKRSAELRLSDAVNAKSNELRREQHICNALMHQ
jgi:hypothetical protein